MTGAGGERLVGDLPIVTAGTAASTIGPTAGLTVSGFGSVGYPKAVPAALAADGRDLSLTVVSSGSVGPEIDDVLVEAGAVDRRHAYQARSTVRAAINDGRIPFSDRHVAGLADDVRYGRLSDADVAIVEAVAVGEDWLIPSTAIGQTPAFVDAADRLIVEVNDAQPRALARFHDVYRRDPPPDRSALPLEAPADRVGGARVEFDPDALTAVVETDAPDEPYTFRDPTDADEAIAEHLRRFLAAEVRRSAIYDDVVRIQFGVGSLGNALMGALGEADLGDRDLVYFGEVVQDGLLDLLEDGRLAAASATSLALSESGFERLFADPTGYAEDVVLRPADVSNDPGLIDRFGVISVNSALEVDLYGHANSTHVDGSQIVNGVGGSGDFTRNAQVSILALPSTADGGDVSRIVPMVPHADHTEHDVDVVVTEQGVTDLRGTAPRERASALVEQCAHPDFRAELFAYLERAADTGGNVPHDLATAFSWDE